MLLIVLFFQHEGAILADILSFLLIFQVFSVELEHLILSRDLFLGSIAKVVRKDSLDRRRWPVRLSETIGGAGATLRGTSADNECAGGNEFILL